MKLGITTTQDLYNLAKILKLNIKVISKDEVYNLKNQNYIINLNNSTEPGSHWVALIKSKNDLLYYWDSYGMPPLIEILKINKNKIFYNKYNIQDIKDENCGYYCIWFIYHMKLYNNDYKKCLKIFVNNNKNNSDILEKFFNDFI
jgi:hypothetical protein